MTNKIQSKLNARYERFRKEAAFASEFAERMSPPLLLCASDRWLKHERRVLVVAQETFGWGFGPGEYYEWPYPPLESFRGFSSLPVAVDALVYGYAAFDFASHQPANRASPFWRAFREIGEAAEFGASVGVLWTNLFRMDLDGGSVVGNGMDDEIEQILAQTSGLLRCEIELLAPHVVIFLTGPRYDFALESSFEGVCFVEIEGYHRRQLSLVQSRCLPSACVRTYHPGYLNRGRWALLAKAISICAARIATEER